MRKPKSIRSQRIKDLPPAPTGQANVAAPEIPISPELQKNIELLKEIWGGSSDIVFRCIDLPFSPPLPATIIYVDGIVDAAQINSRILRTLLVDSEVAKAFKDRGRAEALTLIERTLLTVGEITKKDTLTDLISAVHAGDAVILLDGWSQAIAASLRKWPTRSVEEPATEAVVRGPREGFTETLRVNTALLRHRLKSPHLTFDGMQIGRYTKTDIAVGYIRGLVNENVLREVRERLDRLDLDSIEDSGVLEQYIEDNPLSVFPQVTTTERPDRVVGDLLEGRVAILVDGSPLALVVPAAINNYLQSPEDYYDRFHIASFSRLIRSLALLIALILPSLYIAITTFHQEMLPTPLALSIAASREGKPFPSLIEALLMEITFELVREAGVRLPRPFGQAIGIVGGLVIGQTAVAAGLVGDLLLIFVALTGISAFAIPSFTAANSIRLLRFPLMFLAATAGIYGLTIGILAILIHVISLRSYGTPYLSPIAPGNIRDMKDTVVRLPLWMHIHRPYFPGRDRRNPQRQRPGQRPRAPKEDDQE